MIRIKRFEEFGSGDYAAFDNSSDDNFWGDIAAGVLPICSKTKRILLNLRSKYVNEPNTYGIYGGKLDNDEDITEAVKREFLEESGYNGNIKLIPAFIFKNKSGTFEYHNFICIIDDEFIPELDWESDGYRWVTFEELMKEQIYSDYTNEMEEKHPGLKELLKDPMSLDIIRRNT